LITRQISRLQRLNGKKGTIASKTAGRSFQSVPPASVCLFFRILQYIAGLAFQHFTDGV
jgi:hypothetical protein